MKRNSNSTKFVYFVLALFILIIYISGLFPETTVDSAKYAALSRYVYESGDFLHLKIRGEAYLQKPPLLFWLGALSFRIFGVSIFAFKLPNLLFTFLGIYSVYRLGLLIYNKSAALIAALLYSSSEVFFLYNMDVHTDLLLTSNIIFGTWQLAEYLDKQRIINFILGFVGVGLAMISKGVVGFAVPVFAIAGYLILKKDFHSILSLKWLAGIPVIIIILFPTLKGLYDQFGMPGLKFYFWSNNIDRIRGDYSNGMHDYTFVLHTLAWVFLPWSLYTYSAFIQDWRIWKKKLFLIQNKRIIYCYSAIIIFGLIVTVSSQQAPHYLLPIIPYIAIITSRFIYEIAYTDLYPKTLRLMLILRSLLVLMLWPFIILMISHIFPTRNLLVWLPVLLMFFLMIYSYIRLNTKVQKLIIPPLITILALSFVANTVYMPSALKYHGPIQASYLYNSLASDSSTLYTYNYPHFETYFYPKNVSEYVGKNQLSDILSKETCWIITDETGLKEIMSIDGSVISDQFFFPYMKLTNISFRFLNPETRESALSKIYLLKMR